MKFDTSSITGVLILGGHLDPCANIGTELRFDLLAIPWNSISFAKKASKMVHSEVFLEEDAKSQIVMPPYSEGDYNAVMRGIGLNAWMIRGKYVCDIIPIIRSIEPSQKELVTAQRCIDKIVMNVYPLIYRWPDKNHQNACAIKDFELMLLKHL